MRGGPREADFKTKNIFSGAIHFECVHEAYEQQPSATLGKLNQSNVYPMEEWNEWFRYLIYFCYFEYAKMKALISLKMPKIAKRTYYMQILLKSASPFTDSNLFSFNKIKDKQEARWTRL